MSDAQTRFNAACILILTALAAIGLALYRYIFLT